MKSALRIIAHILVIAVLTLLTQVGGIAYMAALGLTRGRRRGISAYRRQIPRLTILTLAFYSLLTVAVVPPLAEMLGRVRFSCDMTTAVGCALNRTYARPQSATLISGLSRAMAAQFPGSRVTILDASFPFFDGFPLPPHLSHDNGRKIDLAYFYRNAATGAEIPSGSPSPIGYFHFEQPESGDRQPCAGRVAALRWDFAWLQPEVPVWQLDMERTRAMILWLAAQPDVTRIFIEPYLADRLGISSDKVRFQGCNAARHDDHLHVELR